MKEEGLMPLEFATNAACPQNPSWTISEVGYAWARAVYGVDTSVASIELLPEKQISPEHARKHARKNRHVLKKPANLCANNAHCG